MTRATLEIDEEVSVVKSNKNRSKLRLFLFGLIFVCIFVIGYVIGFFTPHDEATIVPEMESWRAGPCSVITGDQCPAGYKSSPPLLLVSFDGFRADYMNRDNIPAFTRLRECGVHTAAMRPTHPAITFPNHYTIATGLHSESHGIVDNTFYDQDLKRQFNYKTTVAKESVWWYGQPIWVTAKKQGKRAYSYFFVGTEVDIEDIKPDIYKTFNSSHSFELRIDTTLDWLSEPDATRPDITTLYFEEPDSAGHSHGTTGAGTTAMLDRVNGALDRIMQGLHERNILHCVNVLIVSDHGMQDMTCDKSFNVQPIFESSLQLSGRLNETNYFLYGGEMGRISLTSTAPPTITDEDIYQALKCPASGAPYQLYRKRDLPRRLHYTNTNRLESTIMNLNAGATVYKSNLTNNWCNGGMHGYDNLYASMDAIFLAQGPSLKSGMEIEPFQNLELYNLMCDLLQVKPADNNGTYGSLHHVLRTPPKEIPNQSAIQSEIAKFPAIPVENAICWAPCASLAGEGMDNAKVDLKLNVSAEENDRRVKAAAPYGIPDMANQTVLVNTDFIVGYNKQLQLPNYASWSFKKRSENNGYNFSSPVSCARNDVRLEIVEPMTCSDFGLLPVPVSTNLTATYLFPPGAESAPDSANDVLMITNVVPMYTSFKTGVWSDFWRIVGLWAARDWKLNVVAGPVFDAVLPFGLFDHPENHTFSMEHPKLRVPSHFFAVVTRDNKNVSCVGQHCLPDVMAFILPHSIEERQTCQDIEKYILTHSATVNDVEKITGLVFYTQLPVYEAIRLRTQLPTKLWHLERGL